MTHPKSGRLLRRVGTVLAVFLSLAAVGACGLPGDNQVSAEDRQAIERVLDDYAGLAAVACTRPVSAGEIEAVGVAQGATGVADYLHGLTDAFAPGSQFKSTQGAAAPTGMRRDESGIVTVETDLSVELVPDTGESSSFGDPRTIRLEQRNGRWLIISDRLIEPPSDDPDDATPTDQQPLPANAEPSTPSSS